MTDTKPDEKVCQGCPDRFTGCMTKVECRQRVESIFKEIEERIILVTPYAIFIRDNPDKLKDWGTLKKREGIK